MSHGVLGWRARATGLGLLLSVVMLTGATCLPPSLDPNAGQLNTAGQTGQTAGQTTGGAFQITVDAPLANVTIPAGAVVQIAWTVFTNGQPAQVTVFYDTDRIDTNGTNNLTVINLGNPGAPSSFNWNTGNLVPGTYTVGARVTDGTNSAVSYAIGAVTVTTSTVVQEMSLEHLGTAMKGCVFEGFSFAGNLGEVMAGRFDFLSATGTPDGVSDFILIAPRADSHYVQDPEVGEAYLLYGWDSQGGARPSWYNGTRFNVNSIGTTPTLPGTILVGPSYITTSLGIAAVQPVADLDGDGGSDLMFGLPLLINARFEDQDYDPCDNGVLYSNAPFALPNPSAGLAEDDHDDFGPIWPSTGYITILGSTSPGLYSAASGLGGVLHVDEIGQSERQDRELHPREIDPTLGVRVYPLARLARFYDFMNNDYRFGAALGIEDVDGDGTPEWLIAEPQATNNAGHINITFQSSAALWGGPPAGGDTHSWPYMIPVGSPCADRLPIWPGDRWGMIDRLRGDELQAPNGQMSNPIGLGDFDGDGLGDIAASTPNHSAGGSKPAAGAAYLVYGRAPFGDHHVGEIKNPVVLDALPGIHIEGTTAGDRFGAKMTGLGRPNYAAAGRPQLRNFNDDALPDWVITAPGRKAGTKNEAGAIAIVWGDGRLDGRFTFDHITTAELPGVIITGANQGDRFGEFICEAGDLNGDGSDDLLVAAPGAENPLNGMQDTGAIYIIYGPPRTGAELTKYQTLTGTYSVADLQANGPVKVRVIYGAVPGHRIGPVAGAGDIDNDGFEDILIGDLKAAPRGRTDAGEVFLVFGGAY